ncbi:hypothetical protein AAY473_008043, partial [Plecturocebus cupreus]
MFQPQPPECHEENNVKDSHDNYDDSGDGDDDEHDCDADGAGAASQLALYTTVHRNMKEVWDVEKEKVAGTIGTDHHPRLIFVFFVTTVFCHVAQASLAFL